MTQPTPLAREEPDARESPDAGAASTFGSLLSTGALGRMEVSSARDYGIVGILIVLFLILTFTSSAFFTGRNLLAILQENAPIGVVAVGTTVCFISGGFDLSIGAAYAMGGVVSALLVPVVGPIPALALGVLAGFGIGILNGLLVTVARINPFVTTLATSIVVGGVATVIHGGAPIFVTDHTYAALGNNSIFGLQATTFVWIVFTLGCGFLLQRTLFGRYVYALGGSEEATRLSGVRVAWVRLGAYGLSGVGAALGGVLVASRASTGIGSAGGFSLAVTAVAGVVIGGTSIMGGEGAIWRTVVGVLILALIGNGFTLLAINANWQAVFQGGLIVLAVGTDTWARRRTR